MPLFDEHAVFCYGSACGVPVLCLCSVYCCTWLMYDSVTCCFYQPERMVGKVLSAVAMSPWPTGAKPCKGPGAQKATSRRDHTSTPQN